MAQAEQVAHNSAHSTRDNNNDEYSIPLETFHILDPSPQNGALHRYRESSWSRWSGMASQSRSRQYRDRNREEADGLLHDTDVIEVETLPVEKRGSYFHSCIYGCSTALSILLFLIILNLIFGFATFLQIPGRSDPFADWDNPETTSDGRARYPTDFLRDIDPIPCHSHNDYWRKVPLFSALYIGCTSVEADVWAFNNELYVGHNTASLTVNRTLKSLYVDPLIRILERQNPTTSFYNGNSHGVFDTDSNQSLTLLIDLKTNGAETLPLVIQQLDPLRKRDWLSYVKDNVLYQRPITVVGTGETPFNMLISNQTYRDVFFDAPLDQMWESPSADERQPTQPSLDNVGDKREQVNSGKDSTDSYTPLNSYYASTSFNKAIGTIWWGKLSNEQMDLIRGQILGAHRRGLKARYWGTPAWPTSLRNYIWTVLMQEGIDVLNVDDIEAARDKMW